MNIRTCALLLAALPSTVFALGFRLVDHDAEAMARAGAFAATADNPSAIFYNQAGIAQLDGTRILLNSYGIGLEASVTPHTPGDAFDSKYSIQALADAFVTWKAKDKPIALGLGFYSPFGLGIEYPDDAAFRTLGKKGRIEFFTANPVIAWKINEQLSIAAGVSLNYSQAKLTRGIVTAGDEFLINGAGFGVGVTAGLLWQPTKQHSFGVQYFGPVDIDYSGHARTHLPNFTTTVQTPVGPFPVHVDGFENEEDSDVKLTLPQTITGGYSFRPTEDWNFEFDLSWTDWNRLNSPTVHLSEHPNSPLVFNYRSSFIYEFGITKKFGPDWRVSAGYLYSENSVPNEYFNPLVPDTNRHVFSLGVGRKFESWDVFLGYQYAYGPPRTISRHVLPGETGFGDQSFANGSYHFQAHALSLSVGYTF